jgi:hypothetical protein
MKEQIEEMAKDLYGYSIDTKEDCEFVAKLLISKGYRKQEWISVDDRLPETRATVLYFDGEWVDACYFDSDNFMTLDTYESDIIDGVTHWMPLPEAPKMKGGAE